MYFVLICLFCITAVLSHDLAQIETRGEVTEPGVEIVRELSDGENILIRSRRSAKTGVCKYKKGNWSECDKKVMVSKYQKLYFGIKKYKRKWFKLGKVL